MERPGTGFRVTGITDRRRDNGPAGLPLEPLTLEFQMTLRSTEASRQELQALACGPFQFSEPAGL